MRSDVVFARKRLAARVTRPGPENNMSHYGNMSPEEAMTDKARHSATQLSLLRPAAEVGPARRQVVTLSFLPSKRRGHGGDLLAPLPPAKHIVCRLGCLAD